MADEKHQINLVLDSISVYSAFFSLPVDVKLDHFGINPLKAGAKAAKVSSATRLADLAETILCSI